MEQIDIGIIGGSGFYQMSQLENKKEVVVDTPFGAPSDSFLIGDLAGKRVGFLARHNRKHTILPSELNFRANIYAFKMLGASHILSASAVGSMKEAYEPTHFVFPDQFIDRTRHRIDTFFGEGIAAHVSFAEPICGYTQKVLYEAACQVGAKAHFGGTYVCMEGPQFSTLAESLLYRSWGVDVIGMTNLQEAKLAREAEIAYATIAMITDYDCWHEEEESVTVEQVVNTLKTNAGLASELIALAVDRIDLEAENPIFGNLKFSIMTRMEDIAPERFQQLKYILGKYQ